MAAAVLHGLIQKAANEANALNDTWRAHTNGEIWLQGATGWYCVGKLARGQDREDFLLSKLTQEGP